MLRILIGDASLVYKQNCHLLSSEVGQQDNSGKK